MHAVGTAVDNGHCEFANERIALQVQYFKLALSALHLAELQHAYYSGKGCSIFLDLEDCVLDALVTPPLSVGTKRNLNEASLSKCCQLFLSKRRKLLATPLGRPTGNRPVQDNCSSSSL